MHPQHLCVNTEHAEMSCQDKAPSLYKEYDYMAEQTTGLWNNSLYQSKEEMFDHNVQNTSYQHKHVMTGFNTQWWRGDDLSLFCRHKPGLFSSILDSHERPSARHLGRATGQ